MSAFEPTTLEDVKRYKNQDHTRFDPAETEARVAAYSKYLDETIAREGPFPKEYWQNEEKQNLLRNVLLELSDDSENDYGKKVYRRDRDEKLKVLEAERDKLWEKFCQEREQIKQENKIRRANGQKELRVPKDDEFENDNDVFFVTSQIEARAAAFKGEAEWNMIEAFGLDRDPSVKYATPAPPLVNLLNLAIENRGFDFDRRCEVAILALRERRRYNQCRRLGIKVPLGYARIYSIKALPNAIQEEITRYPHAIEDDSEYEDDEVVLQKYKDDPLTYIQQYSQQKREKLENGETELRIYKAREEGGDFRFKDVFTEVITQANHQALEDQGIKRGITKEKLDGTYKRPAHITEAFLKEISINYTIETMKKYLDQYGPSVYTRFPGCRDSFLNFLKGDRIKLRKYPDVIRALFQGEEDQIPEDLRVEENPQKSLVIDEFEEHMSRRESLASRRLRDQEAVNDYEIDRDGDDYYERSAFEDEDDSRAYEELMRLKQQQKEKVVGKSAVKEQPATVPSYLNELYKPDPRQQKRLERILDEMSSESSGRTYQKFNKPQLEPLQKVMELDYQLAETKALQESEYWHSFYDYVLKRTKDLGMETFKQYIKEDQHRKLTRREVTSQFLWGSLGSSAEESDDSIKQQRFQHPLLIAKQRVHNQKRVPIKKNFKERADDTIVNIDGKNVKWGVFKKQIYAEVEAKAKKGEKVVHLEFVMNKDDPGREKLMLWNYRGGFQSENSDDEVTKYNRVQRHLLKERLRNHGSKPYLRSRPILPWEKMLLRFGGSEIIKKVSGKRFETKNIETIYEWIDPQKPVFFDYGDFLLQKSEEDCARIYDQEREMQLQVMDKDQWSKSIFANEMVQLYLLMSKVSKDKEVLFPRELRSAIPKTKREYLENINFQMFVSPPSSPRKQEVTEENIANYMGEYQDDDYGGDFEQVDDVQEYQHQTPDNQIEPSPRRGSSKKQKSSEIKQVRPQKPIEIEVPKFIIPKDKGPDYSQLQRRLFDYSETVMVDDYVEIKNIIAELEAIDPEQIERKLIPQLDRLVRESNGRLQGFFIWPHHRVGGMEQIYPNGSRYPKRLKQYKHKYEDKAIYIGGVEVGYLIANVPYLNPDTWRATGMPLTTQSGAYQRTPSKEKATEERKLQVNNKKRKADEALNMGVGMTREQKDPHLLKIEESLEFLKRENPGVYELISIDKNHNDGKSYRVSLALLPNQTLLQKEPSQKSVQIVNTYKMRGLKLAFYNQLSKVQESLEMKETIKLQQRSTWKLTNDSERSMQVAFIIAK